MDMKDILDIAREQETYLKDLAKKTALLSNSQYLSGPGGPQTVQSRNFATEQTFIDLQEIPPTPLRGNNISQQLSSIREKIDCSFDQNTESNENLNEILENLKRIQIEVSQKLAVYQKLVSEKDYRIQELEEKNHALQKESHRLNLEIEEKRDKFDQMMVSKNANIEELQNNLLYIQKESSTLRDQLTSKQTNIEELESLIQKFSSSNAQSEKLIHETQNNVLEKERLIKELEEQIMTHAELSTGSSNSDELSERYRILKEVAFEFKAKLIKRTELLKDCYEENKELRKNNLKLNKQLNRILEAASTMRTKLENQDNKENNEFSL